MATIKKIAKESGFSPSTVSIVLSGKADERKISDETRKLIINTAQKMGYRANISARRLRSNQGSNVMISVFMALDRRASIMMHFLLGLQNAAVESEQPFEIVIHSYKSGTLHTFAETIALTNCAVICNASKEDMAFLDETQFFVPIVLFLRQSKKYCSVDINLYQAGAMAANIFARRGHNHAVQLITESYYTGLDQTRAQFVETAGNHGMTVTRINETHDMKGGYNAGVVIAGMSPMPDCLFSGSSIMSIGALHAFGKLGIKIPEQLELISIGLENPEFEEYASVPISAISVPVDVMAKECIRLLFLQLDGKIETPVNIEVPITYIQRESCGS